MHQTIITSLQNGTLSLTLNRPEVYNAINTTMLHELTQAFAEAANNDAVRVVVVNATGKAFCAGQDIKEMGQIDPAHVADHVRNTYNPLIVQMRALAKPVIASVQGVAAGAGFSLALACDLIIAAEEASFAALFVGLGLSLDSGASYFLPRLVSYAQAFELATLGKRITASEAKQMGIVNQVVPTDKLTDTVKALATHYAQAPTMAIGLIKQLLNQSYKADLLQMLELEAQHQHIAAHTADFSEGVQAFLGKRKAMFKGK